MTPAQHTALKANILADPALVQYVTDGRINAIVAAYNAEASPTFTVWKPDVGPSQLPPLFTWTEVDALTNGKARIWEWMRELEVLDCRGPNVRQGLNDAFGSATATKAAVLAYIKRNATRAERLFATGAGSVASPGTLVFLGDVTDADIEAALRS